jgi:Trypsin-like peptidase domain
MGMLADWLPAPRHRSFLLQPAEDKALRPSAPVALSGLRRLLVRSLVRPLFLALVLLVGSFRPGIACVEPSAVVHSTVGIARYFTKSEKEADPDVVGIRGTGWFLSQELVLTAAHVAEAMHLTERDWMQVEFQDGGSTQSIPVRLARLAGTHSEKIAFLELRTPFPNAQILQVRTEPLVTDERVVSLGFPYGRLRFAGGRFVQYGDDHGFAGSALFELYDGNDRLVLDHGASGAPVLDCAGRAVAVVSNLLTRTIPVLTRTIRVPPPWQSPNVVSVPIQVIKDIAEPN